MSNQKQATNQQNLDRMRSLFEESIDIKRKVIESEQLSILVTMAQRITCAIKNGGKLMLCGNGGSAADAQHLAAELLVRLRPHVNRKGVAALTLAMDSSTLTACGNDFDFEHMYERMLSALGKPGDILLGITTSGNSKNVNLALTAAKRMNIGSFGFLGAGGGAAGNICDLAFIVPSDITGRVQENHITAGHALMELVEDQLIHEGFLQC